MIKGRVIITGIGRSAIIAQKNAQNSISQLVKSNAKVILESFNYMIYYREGNYLIKSLHLRFREIIQYLPSLIIDK